MNQLLFRRRTKRVPPSALFRRSSLGLSKRENPGYLFDIYLATFLLLLVALCYKIDSLGVIALLVLATGAWFGRDAMHRFNLIFVITLLYIADATLTAFFVSMSAGVYRSIQFLIISAGLTGIYLYSWRLHEDHARRALKFIAFASVLIFIHLISYHLYIGRYVTWKYLSDTKLAISLSVFLCFALQDDIKRYISFPVFLAVLFGLIVASAERKAFLLLVVAAAFSTMTWRTKGIVFFTGLLLAGSAALTGWDDGYLANRFRAAPIDVSGVSERFFSTFHNIGDYSDLVREFVNRNAWSLFQENPLLGVGATGYSAWANSVFGPTEFAMNVHGEIHRVPAEGGIAGIAIACFYLIGTFWRTGHFAFLRPERTGSALERAPFLLALYVACYAYAEAIDTSMLLLIGINGLIAARLPSPSLNNLIRGRFRKSRHRRRRAVGVHEATPSTGTSCSTPVV